MQGSVFVKEYSWLNKSVPYAGINRIRFKGSLIKSSQSVDSPRLRAIAT
jgi:hypothetical protein